MRAPDDGSGHERERSHRWRSGAARCARARARSASRCPSATTPAPSCSTTSRPAAASAAPSPGPAGPRTYAELAADACALRRRPAVARLQRGDRVLLFLDDTPAYPAALFGAIRAGLVPLLINTLTPPDLLQFYLVRFRRARSPSAMPPSPTASMPTACDGHAARDPGRRQRRGAAAGARWRRSPPQSGSSRPPPALAPADTHRDDMAFWMYSSGSTGRPKGIVHLQHDMAYTHSSYARHLLQLSERRRLLLGAEDLLRLRPRQLDHLPVRGRRLERAAARPAQARRHLRVHRALPPDGVLRPADALHRADQGARGRAAPISPACASAVSAAEVLSAEVFNAWKAISGLEIMEGLGSTEVLHIYLSNTPTQKKLGAAGKRVPGYEIVLHDPDGREVADGEEGILWVRGDSNAPVLLEPPRQDRRDHARGRLDLHRRPLRARCRRLPLLPRPGRRPRQGLRPVGLSAGGRALPRRPSGRARMRGAGRGAGRTASPRSRPSSC